MHTHLQHLPPIRRPGEPPAWVPDDRIYNDTGRAYHYPQPIRTSARSGQSSGQRPFEPSPTRNAHRIVLLGSGPIANAGAPADRTCPALARAATPSRQGGTLVCPARYRHTPGIHHMPLPSPTARNMGTLQTLPISPRGQPPGHVGTGEHHHTTRRMEPGHATGK